MVDFIAYMRVSTDKQGITGLGMDAQREAVSRYVQNRGQIIAEFIEIESGKRHTNRPQLLAALEECRKRRAVLLIARLDRLARNVAFIANLMESGVDFVAVDMPHATRLTLHILAAVAEHEREMISKRTGAALQAAKARGKKLGRYGAETLAPAHKAAAQARAEALRPILNTMAGKPARQIAAELTARGIETPRGGRWHAQSVLNLLRRLSANSNPDPASVPEAL